MNALLAAGDFELVNVSKWFNAVTIRSTDTLALDTISALPFVQQLRISEITWDPSSTTPRNDQGASKYPTFLKPVSYTHL